VIGFINFVDHLVPMFDFTIKNLIEKFQERIKNKIKTKKTSEEDSDFQWM
jgi:hypothetical protein